MLSSGAVLASECTNGPCPLDKIKAKPCAMYHKPTCNPHKYSFDVPQNVKRYQHFVNKVKRERAVVYNALNLSDEQIKERELILKENTPVYEEKFEKLMKESFRLKALKEADASSKEISRQEKVVNSIKKDIEKLLDKENKAFKKCLTREQRSKYSMIQKLERKDYKEACHKKDYYKKNPKMRPFGNPPKAKECKD